MQEVALGGERKHVVDSQPVSVAASCVRGDGRTTYCQIVLRSDVVIG